MLNVYSIVPITPSTRAAREKQTRKRSKERKYGTGPIVGRQAHIVSRACSFYVNVYVFFFFDFEQYFFFLSLGLRAKLLLILLPKKKKIEKKKKR